MSKGCHNSFIIRANLWQLRRKLQEGSVVFPFTTTKYNNAIRRQWISSSARYPHNRGRLLVYGPDEKGIVASFTQLLDQHGCSILNTVFEQSYYDNHKNTSMFFQRIVFQCCDTADDNDQHQRKRNEIEQTIQSTIEDQFENELSYRLHWMTPEAKQKKRVAIMVSKYDHCLWELLLRHQAGELDCDICVVISNHPDLQPIVQDTFHIPYYTIPKTKDNDQKAKQEEIEMNLLLHTYKVDVIVMARYMQILSPKFIQTFEHKIINIHHYHDCHSYFFFLRGGGCELKINGF